MFQTFEVENSLSAWQQVGNYLIEHKKEADNLLIKIYNPCLFELDWLKRYNPGTLIPKDTKSNDIKRTINTIFPFTLYELCKRKQLSRNDFYQLYLRVHRASKNKKWGTYFERLISFQNQSDINQLEKIIDALSRWQKFTTAPFTLHLSSPIDNPRNIGGPCWHYGQFTIRENVLDFTVVYRNHDYFNKALGNFIALGKLLQYICEQSGKQPGTLVCHSIHAYYDRSEKQMRQLLGGTT